MAAYVPGRSCGTEDLPCASLLSALGGSHDLRSTDYEVRVRPGVYRTSENVGFAFTGLSISLKRWPEGLDQRVVFDCEHGPASFAFKDCSSSSLTGIELRNCPTVLVAGSAGFTIADSHFLDGKPPASLAPFTARSFLAPAQSAALTGGALMITHTKGLVVRDSEFANYTARAGGAVFVDASEGLELKRLRIRDMVASGRGAGGGIHLTSCDGSIRIHDVRLTNCTAANNGRGGGGGGIFIGSCKGKTTLSDATLAACSSSGAGEGGAIRVVGSELVAQRVVLHPNNKRASVRCEGQASVIDVDGTLLLSSECTGASDNNRLHSERDTRLSSAPQNVAHAAVVLVMFILGLNWILQGLEAGAFL